MLDLDSSVSKFPSWRNPFVEDGESLVSELLNCNQRFPDFSSNASASYGTEVLAIEDNGSLDSCSMELELSTMQERLMAETKTEHEPRKIQGISEYDKDAMNIEAEQVSGIENYVGGVEIESHDVTPTT